MPAYTTLPTSARFGFAELQSKVNSIAPAFHGATPATKRDDALKQLMVVEALARQIRVAIRGAA